MPSTISSKSTIAKNTAFLYGRTLLVMFVSLYTSRVILRSLGVEDYGVYTTIGGIVSILTVLIAPIDSAISRFLTYELGKGNDLQLKRYFSAGLTIMLLFCIICIIGLETIGLWFINRKMVLAGDRIAAANWVLHFSIASFVINMVSSPYRASIIAHEEMTFFAYIGVIDVVLKLGVALLIQFVTYDKLVFYAVLLFIEAVVVRVIITIVCNRKFIESRKPKIGVDRGVFGELFAFAGWNVFGAAASVCRLQGTNILFNLFGGPVVNAAFGIANQVNGAVSGFVNNFTTALNPSIIKSFAAKQKDYMLSLVYQGAKYSYFMVLIFALPLMVETQYVTQLWLGQIPEFSVRFIQLMLLHSLIESLSKTIMAGVHASGNIRTYQVVVGGFQLFVLPIAYVLLRTGYNPVSVLLLIILIDLISLFVRVFLAHGIFSLPFWGFVKKSIIPAAITTLIAVPFPIVCKMMFSEGLFRLIITVGISVLITSFAILFIGCTISERKAIIRKLCQLINKE